MDKISKISVKLINLNTCYIFQPRLHKYLEEGQKMLLKSLDRIEAEFNHNKKEERIIKIKL